MSPSCKCSIHALVTKSDIFDTQASSSLQPSLLSALGPCGAIDCNVSTEGQFRQNRRKIEKNAP